MKYYLGELYVTHRKTWFGWMEHTQSLSIRLVIADNWTEAQSKFKDWSTERMKTMKGTWKWESFISEIIN